MKFNCNNEKETEILEENIEKYKDPNMLINIISQVNQVKGNKKKYKDVRKIDLGLCKKDLISFRKKEGCIL